MEFPSERRHGLAQQPSFVQVPAQREAGAPESSWENELVPAPGQAPRLWELHFLRCSLLVLGWEFSRPRSGSPPSPLTRRT